MCGDVQFITKVLFNVVSDYIDSNVYIARTYIFFIPLRVSVVYLRLKKS